MAAAGRVLGAESSKAITSKAWWICKCGLKLYEHSYRTIPSTGGKEYPCSGTKSGRFEPDVRGLDFGEYGLTRK